MNKILILGGYGNFGARIAEALVKDKMQVIIAGRSKEKAIALQQKLSQYGAELIEVAIFNANEELNKQLALLKPCVVINTIGPFQTADYAIPQACVDNSVHYIDLADGRDFVTDIVCLDTSAKNKNVLVVSGASTVPGLSSAVLDHYKNKFSTIEALTYGISPGQKAPRGLATTESILTYLGKPLKPWGNNVSLHYGWQDLYRQPYPELGKRWMANCDIPDLDLFPTKYGISNLRFSAGMESSLLHLGMWLMSCLVRAGLPLNLPKHAKSLLALSHIFDPLGTEDGGMHMILRGKDIEQKPLEIKWFIVAKNNDGPQIPCVPAIILSKKLARNEIILTGALPCVGLVALEEYLAELKNFEIRQYVKINLIEDSNTR